jgi:ubiquinone/menaquinone biosynthesis C-methylase UbiE
MSIDDTKEIQLHRAILNELGYDINDKSKILDFGCGEGETVYQYRRAGFNAFGADIKLNQENDFLKLIQTTNGYDMPFPDKTFDFVFSQSVFEHVQNLSLALFEICRVLKPGGVSLHFFPPRWKPIEDHIFVPFAGVFQGYSWLLLWSFLGVRHSFGRNRRYSENAIINYKYLKEYTAYRSKKELRNCVSQYFDKVVFAERYHIKHSYGRARRLSSLIKIFPFLVRLYSTFHCRVIFFAKNRALQVESGGT